MRVSVYAGVDAEEKRGDEAEPQQPQGDWVRGKKRHQQVTEPLGVVVHVGGPPRKALKFPSMWKNTKPSSMTPVIAITHFLPTADP